MEKSDQSRRWRPVARGLTIGVAFCGGSLFGGLVVWLSLVARAPVTEPVVEARAPLHQAPRTSEDTVVSPGGDAMPVSTVSWSADAWLPSQAAMGMTREKDTRSGVRRGGSAAAPEPWHTLSQHWLSLAVGLLLGGIAAGASVSLWATRRAMARLKARLGEFKRLAAEGKGDWLANLDSDLVGEWRDGL